VAAEGKVELDLLAMGPRELAAMAVLGLQCGMLLLEQQEVEGVMDLGRVAHLALLTLEMEGAGGILEGVMEETVALESSSSGTCCLPHSPSSLGALLARLWATNTTNSRLAGL